MEWWKISFNCSNPDEQGHLLIELGASGIQIEKSGELTCYLQSNAESRKHFITSACQQGFSLVQQQEFENRNWVQACQEILTPVKVGQLEVIPICSLEEQQNNEILLKNQIRIIASTGFGTGHHESTFMALRLLQHNQVQELNPKHILDLGTGSGILAIASTNLYSATITAVDIDSDALDNARQNCSINNRSSPVHLIQGSIEQTSGNYDLILANIYAEVLADLSKELYNRINQQGLLILSGIMLSKRQIIQKTFPPNHWKELAQEQRGNWVSLLLRKLS